MANHSHLEELVYGLSPEEEQEEVSKLAAPIIALGVPDSVFNRTNFYHNGYTFKCFMKLLKYVFSLIQRGILEEALNLGITNNFFKSPMHCDVVGFGKLAHFLRSKEGQKILLGIQRQKKAERKIMKKAAYMLKRKDQFVGRKSDDKEIAHHCEEIDGLKQCKKMKISEVCEKASGNES